MERSKKVKLILSCLSGNILEWFDFAVYGYLAPTIASQFFPTSNKLASIMLTYSVFAIGFLVRPLGAILFGHIGDTLGRKTALVLSSFAMAIPTFIIGLLPNYESIGLAASLLLIVCRIFQGLSIGGEFTGSFVYLVEQGTPGKKGFFSCWADIGCSLGMILGSLCIALLHNLLSAEDISHFGWRIPFLSGILLALVAIYIRLHLEESPEFSKKQIQAVIPFKELMTKFPKTLMFAILLVTINALGFYTLVVFIPNQTIFLEKLPASQSYLINSFILLVHALATFISASACDYFDKTKLYILGCVGCIFFAYPTFYALAELSLMFQIGLMALMAISVGFCYGPRPLFLVEIFPSKLRFSGIAIALNVGNALFGGTAPLLATVLVEKTGIIESASLLVIISAVFSLVAIINLQKMHQMHFSKVNNKEEIELCQDENTFTVSQPVTYQKP